MRIESGPTRDWQVRVLLLPVAFAIFAAWFAYDGWHGWPAQNLDHYLKQLPPEERDRARSGPMYAAVTEASLPQAEAAVKGRDAAGARAALAALYGGNPSYEGTDAWMYRGPAFAVKAPLERGRPADKLIPIKMPRDQGELTGQRYLAAGLGTAAMLSLVYFLRVRGTRLILDDSGLIYHGRGPIAWNEIRRLDSSRLGDKGWVDVHYHDHGTDRQVRLDSYRLASFDAAVEEICRRKGFENPLSGKSREREPAT